jgi:hypothetical protein
MSFIVSFFGKFITFFKDLYVSLKELNVLRALRIVFSRQNDNPLPTVLYDGNQIINNNFSFSNVNTVNITLITPQNNTI